MTTSPQSIDRIILPTDSTVPIARSGEYDTYFRITRSDDPHQWAVGALHVITTVTHDLPDSSLDSESRISAEARQPRPHPASAGPAAAIPANERALTYSSVEGTAGGSTPFDVGIGRYANDSSVSRGRILGTFVSRYGETR